MFSTDFVVKLRVLFDILSISFTFYYLSLLDHIIKLPVVNVILCNDILPFDLSVIFSLIWCFILRLFCFLCIWLLIFPGAFTIHLFTDCFFFSLFLKLLFCLFNLIQYCNFWSKLCPLVFSFLSSFFYVGSFVITFTPPFLFRSCISVRFP